MPQNFPTFEAYDEARALAALSISRDNDKTAAPVYFRTKTGEVVTESVDMEFHDKGGIIVFSTDVNAVELSKNKIVNFIVQKVRSWYNRFTAVDHIGRIAKRFKEITSITIGAFMHGRYYDRHNDRSFDETSTSVEVIGVGKDVLIHLGETIAKEFDQQTVLVKSYGDGEIALVKP